MNIIDTWSTMSPGKSIWLGVSPCTATRKSRYAQLLRNLLDRAWTHFNSRLVVGRNFKANYLYWLVEVDVVTSKRRPGRWHLSIVYYRYVVISKRF